MYHPRTLSPTPAAPMERDAMNKKVKMARSRFLEILGSLAIISGFLNPIGATTNLMDDGVAIVSVNFAEPRVYFPGQRLYVSKEHPHVIRLCVAGDVRKKCFSDTKDLSMNTPGCEVVSSDCTCYRWLFNSRSTNKDRSLSITPHPTKSGCASIVYRPGIETSAQATLRFELDHFRPVIPSGWLYATYARYQSYKKRTKYKKPFFSYVYEASESICGPEKPPPLGTAYNCKKNVEFALVAIDTPKVDRHWSVFAPAFGVIAFLAAAAVYK